MNSDAQIAKEQQQEKDAIEQDKIQPKGDKPQKGNFKNTEVLDENNSSKSELEESRMRLRGEKKDEEVSAQKDINILNKSNGRKKMNVVYPALSLFSKNLNNYERKKRVKGGALAKEFKDEEIWEYMNEEEAKNLGYVRVIDAEATIRLNRPNIVVEQYAKAELREDPDVFESITSLLGNFMFLLRVLLYQLLLSALPLAPQIQLTLLVLNEGIYLTLNLRNYIKVKHLKHVHLLIAKLVQSAFLLLFLTLCCILAFRDDYLNPRGVGVSIQTIGIWCILLAMLFEYIFLMIGIFFIVKALIIQCRKKKDNDPAKKKKDPFVEYKWINTKYNEQDYRQQMKVAEKFEKHRQFMREAEDKKHGKLGLADSNQKNGAKKPQKDQDLSESRYDKNCRLEDIFKFVVEEPAVFQEKLKKGIKQKDNHEKQDQNIGNPKSKNVEGQHIKEDKTKKARRINKPSINSRRAKNTIL